MGSGSGIHYVRGLVDKCVGQGINVRSDQGIYVIVSRWIDLSGGEIKGPGRIRA